MKVFVLWITGSIKGNGNFMSDYKMMNCVKTAPTSVTRLTSAPNSYYDDALVSANSM